MIKISRLVKFMTKRNAGIGLVIASLFAISSVAGSTLIPQTAVPGASGFEESIARLEASRTVVDYIWWESADLDGLRAEMDELGTGNFELRIYRGLDKTGIPEAWFQVVPKSGVAVPKHHIGTYDVSETCPPKCGGG